MLSVEGLTVTYGEAVGLRDLTVSVEPGESVAIIGPNGAGKSSLLRSVAGWLRRDSGRIRSGAIRFQGRDITKASPHHISRLGIAFVPERDKVFTTLTVAEQLSLCAAIRGRARYQAALERSLDLFPRLDRLMRAPAGQLSGGERQMVSIACALCAEPELLMIDELSQGLAPAIVDTLGERLEVINRSGVAVLLVEQSVSVAVALAKRVYVLEAGRLVASDTAENLLANPLVARSYLGQVA